MIAEENKIDKEPKNQTLKKLQPVELYDQLIERIDQWPIYKLLQDRKHFIEEIDNFTLKRLILQNPKIRDLVAETIYLERIRLKETPWKVDPPNEPLFWNKIRKKLLESENETKVQGENSLKEALHKIIHRYSEEIVGTFSIPTFRFARKFLMVFFNRLLNAVIERWWRFLSTRNKLLERIQVFGDIDTVRNLFDKGVVIVVPTHFSNLDSILIGFTMDQVMGLPSFSYGAGLNLYNSGLPAFFMNRLGAYRVDRRKKNDIYLETLKAMSMLSIKRGTNSLFFPGGTRSRSGEIETRLKMGLLGTTVEAQRVLCEENKDKKVFIVPLVVSYHFVLEAPFLIHQHLQITGKEKYIKGRSEGNSLREWFKFVWQFFSKKSDIFLSFGKPMDVLGNFVDNDGNSFDKNTTPVNIKDYFTTEGIINADLQREAEYTKMLADKIVDCFKKENIVLSSHVVAFTAFNMLRQYFERLDLYALLRLPPDDYVFPIENFTAAVAEVQKTLCELSDYGKLKLSEAIHLTPEELVKDGMKNLGIYHVRKPLTFNKKGDIESEEFNTLFYYHNRLDNFGLNKKIKWEDFPIETKAEQD
jgi:glycerol-3-phosphate O-acyltransferase